MTSPGQAHGVQDAIDRVASDWLIRIEEGGLDASAERAFVRWLNDDPRHKSTYEAMRSTWSDISEMPELATLVSSQKLGAARQRAFAARPTRWHLAAGAAVAASLVAGLFFFQSVAVEPNYRTELAATRAIALPDGSSVVLGARSSITVAYRAGERRIILSNGEALFDVHHDAARPFVVDAGSSVIRDVGTRFNVNRTPTSVRIGVLEGSVLVTRNATPAAAPVVLRRGQGAQIVQGTPADMARDPSLSGPIVVTTQEAPGAWREGRLVFDNVRLADLSADVNRYYAPGVTLGSAAVGDLRVTAAFKTSEIPAFMSALDATLPVRTERSPEGKFRIVDARK